MKLRNNVGYSLTCGATCLGSGSFGLSDRRGFLGRGAALLRLAALLGVFERLFLALPGQPHHVDEQGSVSRTGWFEFKGTKVGARGSQSVYTMLALAPSHRTILIQMRAHERAWIMSVHVCERMRRECEENAGASERRGGVGDVFSDVAAHCGTVVRRVWKGTVDHKSGSTHIHTT